ncbi:hypothetical protein BDV12DRAFT_207367 [Aspergillus spectabilis]
MSSADFLNHARTLVHNIATEITAKHGLSSMTVSIYDTAWLSMVQKVSVNGKQWLFPESFTFLLKHQGPEGGWDPLMQSTRADRYPDPLWIPDCIVHSLAALLALCRHFKFASNAGEMRSQCDIHSRIFRAKRFLDIKLAVLNIDNITHFGFELLVPVLFRLLAEEGFQFDFPAKEELLSKYEKASSVDMTWLYNDGPCKIPLFCLEAFLGKIDFSRLAHLVTSTAGVSASPASTASYLIHSNIWSDQGESYLQHVVGKRGDGAVGGVFPLEIFEPCWVLTALLENGFTGEELGLEDVEQILGVIRESLADGVTSATHVFFPDADDTARALTILNLSGFNISQSSMIQRFEGHESFDTFDDQLPNRVSSVSVNGNVLNALLHSPNPDSFAPQIEKIARFLCSQWEQQRFIHDHWNISPYYGLMHIAQSLSHLITVHNRGGIPLLSPHLTRHIIPSTLDQVLDHLLTTQNTDGTWGSLHCREETAYAVISLAHIAFQSLILGERDGAVDAAIARSKRFLAKAWVPDNPSLDRLWTGKVLHGVAYVAEAYVLAALRVDRVKLAGACDIDLSMVE